MESKPNSNRLNPSVGDFLAAEHRFWVKVDKSGSCWNWTAERATNGYGRFHLGRKHLYCKQQAHRVALVLHTKKEIPKHLHVCHHCDNRKCVRPDHLFVGTRSDNMRDCANKKRVCNVGYSRRTRCTRGHPYSNDNTRISVLGHRICRICAKNCAIRGRQRRRALSALSAKEAANGKA